MAGQLHLAAASVGIKKERGREGAQRVIPSPVLEVAKAIILCICDWKHLNEYCRKKSKITRDQIGGENASWREGLAGYLEDRVGISKVESRERVYGPRRV